MERLKFEESSPVFDVAQTLDRQKPTEKDTSTWSVPHFFTSVSITLRLLMKRSYENGMYSGKAILFP
jgi:hypothetical protein